MLVLHNGYAVALESTRSALSPTRLEVLLRQNGQLWDEIRNFRKMIGEDQWVRYIESCHVAIANSKVTIRDYFPIVEYPVHLRNVWTRLVSRLSFHSPAFLWVCANG